MTDNPTLVVHPRPVLSEPAVEAWTYIDPSYGFGWEKLFVSEAGDGLWKVCNLPYHVYGLKIGSLVKVSQGGQIIEAVSHPEGIAARLCFQSPEQKGRLARELSSLMTEEMFGCFMAVQSPPGQENALNSIVQEWMEKGHLSAAEDIMGQAFDSGPVPDEAAPDGEGPRTWTPS